jgi:Fe-S cluster biogenesis protein NfuA
VRENLDHRDTLSVLARHNGFVEPTALVREVESVIEVIRPIIQQDEGDIALRGVDEKTGVVSVELMGACVTCPASSQTLKAGVERILKDRVEGVTEVVNVNEPVDDGTSVSL